MNHAIENIVKQQLSKYFFKKEFNDINLTDRLYKDLNIYGDDFEEFIDNLNQKINFNTDIFWEIYKQENFYNPSEFYIPLRDFFNKNIFLWFKKKQNINEIKIDLTVDDICKLIEKSKY